MNFVKTTIHFQNSSSSLTLHVPEFIFRAPRWCAVFAVIGLLMLAFQLIFTTIHDSLLEHGLSDRLELNEQLSQIEGTMEYLSGTSADFFRDEQRLHAKFGLPLEDESSRELGSGGLTDPDSLLLRGSSPVYERTSLAREEAERLQNKIENNGASFSTLTEYINQKQSHLRYIPSIAPTNGHYASAFGPRLHPVTGEVGKMHQGIDISNDRWTPIFAAADGVVDVAQLSTTFGNYVTINHGNNIKTRYGHMQMSTVKPGQFVRRYQLIGYMGNTGRSVGPHLHYEVWVGSGPVNPLTYILPNDHSVE